MCRDTICQNDKVIQHAIAELGSRPAVPTLEVHIKAFYDQVNVTVDGPLYVGLLFACDLR